MHASPRPSAPPAVALTLAIALGGGAWLAGCGRPPADAPDGGTSAPPVPRVAGFFSRILH